MEPIVLTDPSITPDEELVFALIGEKSILWKSVQKYIYSHHKDITDG
ncbi:MAG: hypothetical protein WCI31_09990 [Prolixibacteraceae bacterium]